MKKHLYRLLAAITTSFIFYSASAQTDSLLDLGRVKLRKDFTQTVTIKGKYLEKIPFSTIHEIISPWLQGIQNNKYSLVYVVDGNMVSDVNAWSIHDIEEITLVQNAMSQVNGANANEQLVLIKTKRNHEGQKGISITGSTHLVKNKFYSYMVPESESETNFYHQYQVTAWKNTNNFRFGLSANFLRDVYPTEQNGNIKANDPIRLNRFRLNGWMDVTLAEGHSLSASLNVVPQKSEYELESQNAVLYDWKDNRTLIYPSIKLSNRLAKGLTNELSVSYITVRNPSDNKTTNFNPGPPVTETSTVGEGLGKVNNLFIRENLGYSTTLGNWALEPSVNLTYRSVNEKFRSTMVTLVNGNPQSQGVSTSTVKAKSFILTPSVSLSYRNIFNITGGISTKLDDEKEPVNEGIFPFASLSLDIWKLAHPANASSLKFFGSYARPADFGDNAYSLGDLFLDPGPNPFGPIYGTGLIGIIYPYPDDPKMQAIGAGATFHLPENKLQISYNYDNREFVLRSFVYQQTPMGLNIATIWPQYTFTAHRLGVTSQVINKTKMQWLAGINVNTYKYLIEQVQVGQILYPETKSNSGKNIWTGGITNRFQYDKFSVGLDVLYVLNDVFIENFTGGDKKSDWRISNIYASYQLQVKNKPLELFLSGRNLSQGFNPNIGDRRRFYGAGFRLQL